MSTTTKQSNTNEQTSTTTTTSTEQPQQQQSNHMLAISFVDGTIYLMHNYDEVFPIIIETSLINIKMEWSMNGELLAIGGHRIIRSSSQSSSSSSSTLKNGFYMYQNIINIYRFDGTLIRQCQLDFNYQPLSALTWACNDRRLFIACGQLLFVAWIIHGYVVCVIFLVNFLFCFVLNIRVFHLFNRIPSLSFISALQVYNRIKNEIDITRLQVPIPVKLLLNELFTPTVHCYLPDYHEIGRFVFRPPANNIRLHCTLMRHDETTTIMNNSQSSSSSIINHYAQQQQFDSSSSSIANQSSSNDDTIYILYLEYLGGLVPILKGKRSSKIKPEFIIFDPQRNVYLPSTSSESTESATNFINENQNNFNSQKISTTTTTSATSDMNHVVNGNGGRIKHFLQNSVWTSANNNRNLTTTTTTDSENDENSNHSSTTSSSSILYHLTPKTRRRLRCRTPQFNGHHHRGHNQRFHDDENNNLEQQQQQFLFSNQASSSSWIDDNLPVTDKIVLITSNIWGTKFKFVGLTPKLPSHLGSVTYRTSLLHLQPRQMSLVIKELNDKNTLINDHQKDNKDEDQMNEW